MEVKVIRYMSATLQFAAMNTKAITSGDAWLDLMELGQIMGCILLDKQRPTIHAGRPSSKDYFQPTKFPHCNSSSATSKAPRTPANSTTFQLRHHQQFRKAHRKLTFSMVESSCRSSSVQLHRVSRGGRHRLLRTPIGWGDQSQSPRLIWEFERESDTGGHCRRLLVKC